MFDKVQFRKVQREPEKNDYVLFRAVDTEDVTAEEFYKVINSERVIFRDDVGDNRSAIGIINSHKTSKARFEVFERFNMEVENT